jgi:hypothetical protein
VVGFLNNGGYDNPYDMTQPVSSVQTNDIGVYARITIPIGAPKERLNCNSLYQLELEKKRMEVFRLKQEVQNLRNLQFVQDVPIAPVANTIVATEGEKD